jgi:hypothetical protein
MQYTIIAFLAAFCSLKGLSQTHTTTVIYDGRGNVIGGSHIRIPQGKPVTLTDTASGVIFSLDSAHIMVSAHDKKDSLLWKTDPWKDNKIEVYRTDRPVIVDFQLLGPESKFWGVPKGKTVLWIVYINTQFGYLDLETGKFRFMGQD